MIGRQKEFLEDLREVLNKHKVKLITDEDHFPGYPESGEEIRITAEFDWIEGGENPKDIQFDHSVAQIDIEEELRRIENEN